MALLGDNIKSAREELWQEWIASGALSLKAFVLDLFRPWHVFVRERHRATLFVAYVELGLELRERR